MTQILFFLAASLMLIDAIAYSFGALNPLHQKFAPDEIYWSKRLQLNLMLANAELYFTSFFALLGVYLSDSSESASLLIITITLFACLYSVVTILSLTPSDWRHAIPRLMAAILIATGLVLSYF